MARALLQLANDLKSALHHPWVYVLWMPNILPAQTVTMEGDSAAQHFKSAKTCSLRRHACRK
jgi:hypothetical protein